MTSALYPCTHAAEALQALRRTLVPVLTAASWAVVLAGTAFAPLSLLVWSAGLGEQSELALRSTSTSDVKSWSVWSMLLSLMATFQSPASCKCIQQ